MFQQTYGFSLHLARQYATGDLTFMYFITVANTSTNRLIQGFHNKWKPRIAAGRPASYLALPLVLSASYSQSVPENVSKVVFTATTEIPALILWLEIICSSSARKQKVRWAGNSTDVTEDAQCVYRRPLNTPHIFEGIPAKHYEVHQQKSKQPRSLSLFGELQQCEACSCTIFLLGFPTNKFTNTKIRRFWSP
jgi:hypothetical protein